MLLICCCSLIPQKVRRVCLACLLILTSGLLSLTLNLRRQQCCTIASQRYQFSILILHRRYIHMLRCGQDFICLPVLYCLCCFCSTIVEFTADENQSSVHFQDWLKKKSLMQINVAGALFILAKVVFFANLQLFMWLNIALGIFIHCVSFLNRSEFRLMSL